jgi:peptidoglycan/xylan/chitin deacetylase (PgdA/CDA1 family)
VPSRLVAGAALLGLLLAGCSASAAEQPVAPLAASPSPKASASDGAKPSPSGAGTVPVVGPDAVVPGGKLPIVHFKIKTTKPVFFITVDDGVQKQKAALDYVRSVHLPLTTFLYNGVVDGEYGYFKAISAWDAVQNHTMDHKALSKASTNVVYEVCAAQKIYQAKYGVRPWLLRPPYGAGFMPTRPSAPRILAAAASCGIKHVVLWNVSVEANGKVSFAGPSHLRAGDIVLLHFEGDLASNLKKVVQLGKARGLTPASLSAFLGK